MDQVLKSVNLTLANGKANSSASYKEKPSESVQAQDWRKEGAVLALGACALHISNKDQIHSIIQNQLLPALSTPSQAVQHSVAKTMIKLIKKCDPSIVEVCAELCLSKCLDSSSKINLATRKGNAYGIAAIVKGKGISTLKKYGIITKLQSSLSQSEDGDAASREGALYCISELDILLKLLFEPYVLQLLPGIIQCFADVSQYVRTAAEESVHTIMSNLSNHGVKLVLPVILSNFQNDDSESKPNSDDWRAKLASLKILGSVGNISPKFVGQYLPKVIPILIEQHSSTNIKVRTAADEALRCIVSTIQNPEISSLQKVILEALVDGSGERRLDVLEGLIAQNFTHAIDTPSISITIPILLKSLKASTPSTHKRLACLILGTFCEILEDVGGIAGYGMSIFLCACAVLLTAPLKIISTNIFARIINT